MVLGLLIGVWIARYLGPAQYGQLAYVIAFVAFFQAIVNLGIDGLVVRDLANRGIDPASIAGTALRIRVGTAIVCFVLACGIMAATNPGDDRMLLLTVLISASLLFQPADIVDLWFISESQSWRSVLARLAALAISSGAKITFLVTKQPLWVFATTQVLEAAFAAAILAATYRRHPIGRPWTWNAAVARDLAREGWPILLAGLSIIVYMRVDQLVLLHLAGELQLGLYSAMLPFSQAWNFVPVTVCGSAAPYLVRLYSESSQQFEYRIRQLFFIMIWSATLLVVVISGLSGHIVRLFLGPQYRDSSEMLAVHALTNVAVFVGVAQVLYLTTVRRSRVILIQAAAGAVVSVATNLALVPRLGGQGAALAAVLAYTTSAILVNFFVAKDLFKMQIQSIWWPGVR